MPRKQNNCQKTKKNQKISSRFRSSADLISSSKEKKTEKLDPDDLATEDDICFWHEKVKINSMSKRVEEGNCGKLLCLWLCCVSAFDCLMLATKLATKCKFVSQFTQSNMHYECLRNSCRFDGVTEVDSSCLCELLMPEWRVVSLIMIVPIRYCSWTSWKFWSFLFKQTGSSVDEVVRRFSSDIETVQN